MKKTSAQQCVKLILAGVLSPMLLSSSCGRAPVEYLEDIPNTVDVTGAFTDWTPGTSSFAGGRFILLEASTSEVFASNEISAAQPSFKIENVPVAGRYYGILIDSRFEPRAYIEKDQANLKELRVFKLANSMGKLGTIVVRNMRLEPSQQGDLEFQANIGVVNDNKPYEKEFSTTYIGNPDIDEDGIPNAIDINVDGDDIPNIFDAFTYKSGSIPDSSISWQYNYAYGIPKTGFFKCNFLRSPGSLPTEPQTNFNLIFSCMLRLPIGQAESVDLTTVKTFLENSTPKDALSINQKMKDDGSAGDLIASDGIWTAQFSISENATEVFKEQLILANVKLNAGARKTFVTHLEPKTILTGANLIDPACSADKKTVEFGLKKESLDQLKADIKNFLLTLTLKRADGQDVSATPPRLKLTKDDSEKYKLSIDDNPVTLQNGTYYLLVKVTAPSALPGLLGSAFEFYLPRVTLVYDTSQEQKIKLECIP